MAAALVQTGTALNVGGGTSGTITLTGVAAGNLLVVYADDIDGLGATFSISDDQGNTWAQAVHNDNGGYTSSIHYCLNAAAGTTVITVTASTSTAFLAQAQEYSGGTWTLDTTSSIDETSTTSHVCSASGSVIDTAGEDVVVCNSTTADGGNFGTRTAGSGYTGLSSPTAQCFWQYQIFSTAQANEQGPFTSANSKATAACIAAFLCTPDFIPCGGSGGDCWWPCCGGATGTPACATVGSVGSESGDECTACATSRITDDFSSSLDADWSAAIACPGGGLGGPLGLRTSGGEAVTDSEIYAKRPFTRPALSGFCVHVKATLTDLPSLGSQGIFLAYGRAFFARPSIGDYGRQSCITFEGCIDGTSTFANFGPTPADGDVIEMIFRDQGGADGICSICYIVNGTTVRVEEDVQTCFDSTMYAGLMTAGISTCKWDDFEVLTS